MRTIIWLWVFAQAYGDADIQLAVDAYSQNLESVLTQRKPAPALPSMPHAQTPLTQRAEAQQFQSQRAPQPQRMPQSQRVDAQPSANLFLQQKERAGEAVHQRAKAERWYPQYLNPPASVSDWLQTVRPPLIYPFDAQGQKAREAIVQYQTVTNQVIDEAAQRVDAYNTQLQGHVQGVVNEKDQTLQWVATQKQQALGQLNEESNKLSHLLWQQQHLQSISQDAGAKRQRYLEQAKAIINERRLQGQDPVVETSNKAVLSPEQYQKALSSLDYWTSASTKVIDQARTSLIAIGTRVQQGHDWMVQAQSMLETWLGNQYQAVNFRLARGRTSFFELQRKTARAQKIYSDAILYRQQYDLALHRLDLVMEKKRSEDQLRRLLKNGGWGNIQQTRADLEAHLASLQQVLADLRSRQDPAFVDLLVEPAPPSDWMAFLSRDGTVPVAWPSGPDYSTSVHYNTAPDPNDDKSNAYPDDLLRSLAPFTYNPAYPLRATLPTNSNYYSSMSDPPPPQVAAIPLPVLPIRSPVPVPVPIPVVQSVPYIQDAPPIPPHFFAKRAQRYPTSWPVPVYTTDDGSDNDDSSGDDSENPYFFSYRHSPNYNYLPSPWRRGGGSVDAQDTANDGHYWTYNSGYDSYGHRIQSPRPRTTLTLSPIYPSAPSSASGGQPTYYGPGQPPWVLQQQASQQQPHIPHHRHSHAQGSLLSTSATSKTTSTAPPNTPQSQQLLMNPPAPGQGALGALTLPPLPPALADDDDNDGDSGSLPPPEGHHRHRHQDGGDDDDDERALLMKQTQLLQTLVQQQQGQQQQAPMQPASPMQDPQQQGGAAFAPGGQSYSQGMMMPVPYQPQPPQQQPYQQQPAQQYGNPPMPSPPQDPAAMLQQQTYQQPYMQQPPQQQPQAPYQQQPPPQQQQPYPPPQQQGSPPVMQLLQQGGRPPSMMPPQPPVPPSDTSSAGSTSTPANGKPASVWPARPDIPPPPVMDVLDMLDSGPMDMTGGLSAPPA